MGQSSINRGLSCTCPWIAAAALLPFVFGYCGVASAAEPAPAIEGVWEGRYVCAQGPTGATLTIKVIPYWPEQVPATRIANEAQAGKHKGRL